MASFDGKGGSDNIIIRLLIRNSMVQSNPNKAVPTVISFQV